MLETNVQDVSFWDKNADLQELRLRQGQTLKVTDKKTCFYSVPLWFVWNLLGRGTPLYNPYSYVPLQKGRVLKTCIYFAHVGVESGMVFEETTGVYERVRRKSNIRIRSGF